jgi:hypothetical protein
VTVRENLTLPYGIAVMILQPTELATPHQQ